MNTRWICATIILLAGAWFANDAWHYDSGPPAFLILAITLTLFYRAIRQ